MIDMSTVASFVAACVTFPDFMRQKWRIIVDWLRCHQHAHRLTLSNNVRAYWCGEHRFVATCRAAPPKERETLPGWVVRVCDTTSWRKTGTEGLFASSFWADTPGAAWRLAESGIVSRAQVDDLRRTKFYADDYLPGYHDA